MSIGQVSQVRVFPTLVISKSLVMLIQHWRNLCNVTWTLLTLDSILKSNELSSAGDFCLRRRSHTMRRQRGRWCILNIHLWIWINDSANQSIINIKYGFMGKSDRGYLNERVFNKEDSEVSVTLGSKVAVQIETILIIMLTASNWSIRLQMQRWLHRRWCHVQWYQWMCNWYSHFWQQR